eukprot:gnl/TRDRNA2_/TRDRNA2_176649_c4_seq1.p1 gnl/TRDRNA2_/TRDRNA2_176649_c4~~gnl/TRDRNA2_/TRDRNA2_176649_c4_seq1.p1  ORF type:complete len:297 (-),score=32.93 gnl/TRDRNA2_/TRDRNA2_176649_c4_seq1:126-1016(-)
MDMVRSDGDTLRYRGGVLRVAIEYSNAVPMDWRGQAPMDYKITVTLLPLPEFKHMHHESIPEEKGGGRIIHNTHGLLIISQVIGRMRVFNFTHLLQVLTTAFTLLAISTFITEGIMLRCMGHNHYRILKYQPSQHFSKIRTYKEMLKTTKHLRTSPQANVLRQFIGSKDAVKQMWKCRDFLGFEASLKSAQLPFIDLLAILVKHEQRLNRIDATDDQSLGKGSKTTMAYFLRLWETRYWHYALKDDVDRKLLDAVLWQDAGYNDDDGDMADDDPTSSTYRPIEMGSGGSSRRFVRI